MTFRPGQSGNPTGRAKHVLPDGRTLGDLAREVTVEALECAVEIMRDKAAPHAARASVIATIFDRGWGRPAQSLTVSGDPDAPLFEVVGIEKMSDAALREMAELKIVERGPLPGLSGSVE